MVPALLFTILPFAFGLAQDGPEGTAAKARLFEAGAAREDITPPPGLPMWGYGARKDAPSQGALDPLSASAVVIRAGDQKIALVGLDLGRSPARATLKEIREEIREKAGVGLMFLVGSHTHHGPCLELEKAGATAEYIRTLRQKIVNAIVRAAGSLRPARIGVASEEGRWNRNRHSHIEPKPVDRLLNVLRLDGLEGKPIAILVNFAAHPTTRDAALLKWSADYPAPLRGQVEKEMGGICVFLEGAAGDLSADRQGMDTDAFGKKLGEEVVRIAKGIDSQAPGEPSIKGREEEFHFASRINLSDPITYAKYCFAFFKDLVDAYVEEYREGVRPNLTVVLLNGNIGLVGGSGEFFSSHAVRLRERARLPHLFFFGYTNGYHQYFPTIEAVSEGGYGADPDVSPVEIGAGERMMDRALFHLYDLRKPMR